MSKALVVLDAQVNILVEDMAAVMPSACRGSLKDTKTG
jgi:hypothetical protein